MPTELQFPLDFAYGTPFTPLKSASNSPAPASQAANSKSKARNGNKARPKNVSTSPRPVRQGHNTPPNTAVPKATSATAFAGATFHASPAPSSLPIPSFLAKAMDSPGIKHSDRAGQEPSPPPTDSEAPTPHHLPSTSQPAREESPLDIFFRAHRAETERANRATCADTLAAARGPFSPPIQTRSPRGPEPAPNGPGTLPRRGPVHRSSPVGISTAELDGTPGRPIGPAFSTPFQERIKAARSNEKQGGRSSIGVQQQQQGTPAERSEALKRFLALSSTSPSAPAKPNGQSDLTSPTSQNPFSGGAVLPRVQQTTATSSGRQDGGRPQDLLQMEASLRRILKLDSGPSFGQAPTIANSQSS
ncbi:hypothetical protein QBC33DRAFT_514108 [Phialemonium atrogriseum]|uniref:Proteophosphoglycan 5 n=1 Tax=Phialemonium atrogriseum TaxID=1093897 RepID=A0AAJ0C4E6_9PEZI|nr:uncharacterized protein QBC33DRAFT_514108 [Phialemonium atrogriseum]KAK1768514.1 hypothetical protein QBC33DRAFT_514108 [Phialemonium atrogriseum]